MSKIVITNFTGSVVGNNPELRARQTLLNDKAIEYGVADKALAWTREDLLKTEFYQQNRNILDQERGAGFWSWKPYVILESIKRLNDSDWLVYCDVGKAFRRDDQNRAGKASIGNVLDTPFDDAIEYAKQHEGFTPGIWVPHYGPAKMWTKRDCFVGMSCDQPEYHNSGQVQAGYSIWSNTKAAIAFLEEWLKWCLQEAIVSDNANIYGLPNFDEFKDHRHDQSIITNLVIKHKLKLFGPREQSMSGYRDFNLILKHMMLAGSLRKLKQSFAVLFQNELPKWLKLPLELYCLPIIAKRPSVWLLDGSYPQWQTALPTAQIKIGMNNANLLSSDKLDSKQQYAAIFAHKLAQEADLITQLGRLFDALTPGGTLLIGPFNGNDQHTPRLNGTFAELIRWIDTQQRFPEGMTAPLYCQRNAITLGNVLNPLIAWGPNDQDGYAIIRKPLSTLV